MKQLRRALGNRDGDYITLSTKFHRVTVTRYTGPVTYEVDTNDGSDPAMCKTPEAALSLALECLGEYTDGRGD